MPRDTAQDHPRCVAVGDGLGASRLRSENQVATPVHMVRTAIAVSRTSPTSKDAGAGADAEKPAEDAFVLVAAGEHQAQVGLGERAQLAVAQEGLVLAVRVEEHVEAHRRAQPRLGAVDGRHRAAHAVEEIVERAVEDREEDVLLGREVIVEARPPPS